MSRAFVNAGISNKDEKTFQIIAKFSRKYGPTQVRGKLLCGFLEQFEPQRQPVPNGTVLTASRHVDLRPGDALEAEFEEWAIVDFEQPVGDVNLVIGIDADQMGVEGRVMELR
jgi:hypothetical protein